LSLRQAGTLYYLLTDHLGSTALTVNSSGSKVGELRYRAYGETRYAWGTTPTSRRFTGQLEEGTIGLYDYGARFYDPLLGRFLSADTVVPQPGNPQALNRYAYVLNNPLRYTDPSGHYVLLEDPVDTPFAHISEFSVRISSDGTIQILSGGQHFRNYYEKSIANYILSEGRTQLPPRPGGMFGGTIGRTVSNVEVGLGYKRPRLGDAVADIATDPMALYGVAMFAGKLTKDAAGIVTNPLPRTQRFARAVPVDVARLIDAGHTDITLAKPGDPDVFITAAEDLARYRSQSSVERRLGLPPGQRAIVTFNYDIGVGGIASPIWRDYPEFVGGGLTRGGAREWVIPNWSLNELTVSNIQVRYLR